MLPTYSRGLLVSSRVVKKVIIAVFFAVAFGLTVHHDAKMKPDILNRDQTEEWKGWMQLTFLLYHYYEAGELYNSVRVMITCYIWMTGFGNLSFFYIKRDFGWIRFYQVQSLALSLLSSL